MAQLSPACCVTAMPGRFVRSEWAGFEAQHRYEDLALIGSVLEDQEPGVTVELGTAKGGFTAFLASHVMHWEGKVFTVDILVDPEVTRLCHAFPNVQFLQANILSDPPLPAIVEALKGKNPVLYCDNGKKELELFVYAPLLPVGGLVGTHDYGTEVNVKYAETLMSHLGYTPHRHEEFAALADPVNYPASLTRFWRRIRDPLERT